MSHSVSSNLQTHFEGEVLTLADIWRIVRRDGVEYFFTTHVEDIEYDGDTYLAQAGIMRTAFDASADLSPANTDVRGVLLDSDSITDADLRSGVFVDAEVWYAQLNYESPADGLLKLEYGRIGRVEIQRGTYVAELRGFGARLQQTLGAKRSRYCRAELGDSVCGIELEPGDWQSSTVYGLYAAVSPTVYDGRRYVCTTAGTSGGTEPTWDTTVGNTTTDGSMVWTCFDAYTKQGTVDGSSDRQTFVDAERTEATNWFRFGKVTWLTGNNAGLSMDVKSDASGSILLKFPMPFDIEAGDTYKITVGCNHLLKMPGDTDGTAYTGDCRAKFRQEQNGNAYRFDGDPHMPGQDKLLSGPS